MSPETLLWLQSLLNSSRSERQRLVAPPQQSVEQPQLQERSAAATDSEPFEALLVELLELRLQRVVTPALLQQQGLEVVGELQRQERKVPLRSALVSLQQGQQALELPLVRPELLLRLLLRLVSSA
jgi:hypothetical protein